MFWPLVHRHPDPSSCEHALLARNAEQRRGDALVSSASRLSAPLARPDPLRPCRWSWPSHRAEPCAFTRSSRPRSGTWPVWSSWSSKSSSCSACRRNRAVARPGVLRCLHCSSPAHDKTAGDQDCLGAPARCGSPTRIRTSNLPVNSRELTDLLAIRVRTRLLWVPGELNLPGHLASDPPAVSIVAGLAW